MARIDCVVDTNPMAREIDSVSTHIQTTTAAVIGMKAAVVAAESEAANHVVANVNRGFYTLIRSQISQKVAKLQSEVDSHLMKLNQLRKQLTGIQSRMHRDYNMISARYTKLFGGLNKNLQVRVFELDRPVINFAVRDVEQVSNRTRMLTATVPVAQLETLTDSQRILVSNIKYRGLKVIDSISRFLESMMTLRTTTGKILLSGQAQSDNRTLALPVAICESRYDADDNRHMEVFLNTTVLSADTCNAIRNSVYAGADALSWLPAADCDNRVRSEFLRIAQNADMSDRVRQTAVKMFLGNRFETLA